MASSWNAFCDRIRNGGAVRNRDRVLGGRDPGANAAGDEDLLSPDETNPTFDWAFQLFPNPDVQRHYRAPGLDPKAEPIPVTGAVFEGRHIEDEYFLEQLIESAGFSQQRVAIILVDMQGGITTDDWRWKVCAQLEVLDRAMDRQVPIYQTVYVSGANRPEPLAVISRFLSGYPNHIIFEKSVGNSLTGVGEVEGQPRALLHVLREGQVGTVIVMGQDANVCVLSTIFGQYDARPSPLDQPPYIRGLLDIGCSVVTSLDVLIGASPLVLEPIYWFRRV